MNVSVIIPVYNAASFVTKAVESSLSLAEVKEIILIEDGSTDNSFQVCEKLVVENERVHLYQHPNGINKGASASRNLGIKKASQEYISFLDADDYMQECRFEKEKIIFANIKEADGVYGAIGVEYLDEIGAKAWELKGFDRNTLTTVTKPILPEHLFEYLIYYKNIENYSGYFSIDGLTLRSNALHKYNIYFDEDLRLHQDTVFIYQCAYYLKLYTGEYEKPVAIRGVHKDNRITTNKNISDSRLKVYQSLIKWSKESKLEKEYKIFFKQEYNRLSNKDFKILKLMFLPWKDFLLKLKQNINS